MTKQPNAVDYYIAAFPARTQELLQQLRRAIHQAAPGAEETIRYGIPTLRLNGNLVHFAAHKNHIGFYSAPTGNEAFKDELSVYKSAKGSVQFPLDQPLPLALITRMTQFRVTENARKLALKNSVKPQKSTP